MVRVTAEELRLTHIRRLRRATLSHLNRVKYCPRCGSKLKRIYIWDQDGWKCSNGTCTFIMYQYPKRANYWFDRYLNED